MAGNYVNILTNNTTSSGWDTTSSGWGTSSVNFQWETYWPEGASRPIQRVVYVDGNEPWLEWAVMVMPGFELWLKDPSGPFLFSGVSFFSSRD